MSGWQYGSEEEFAEVFRFTQEARAEIERLTSAPACHQCATDRHQCCHCGAPVPHGSVLCAGCDV